MSDERYLVRRDRPEGVVHHLKKQSLQIGDVARHMERHDLPLAIAQHLVTALETLEHDTALRGPVAFPQDVLVWPDLLDHDGKPQEDVLFRLGKWRRIDVQPSNEPMQRRFKHSLTLSRTRACIAIECREQAGRAKHDDTKASWLKLAAQWQGLADEAAPSI